MTAGWDCGNSWARTLSYQPGWLVALRRVRKWVLGLFDREEAGPLEIHRFSADSLPVKQGEMADFFEILGSDGRTYWIGSESVDSYRATLGVVGESLGNGTTRFHVVTLMHFRNRLGPLFFALIRPLHDLFLGLATRSAVRS
ncbi:DUF2867 domain-containing protein [Pseudodesulfovibrio tunisiensis]|uniref:DUF2867 domain-containing protein n=1 Tax=Pseudodesulfovibrio tunisiensis TaxID=463192 RepID=UPI001FB3EA03|nr:DUF2867 domain-containing protein [Pseudodesulfovibrio tunisiensis]